MTLFIIGLFAGVLVGFFAASLFTVSKSSAGNELDQRDSRLIDFMERRGYSLIKRPTTGGWAVFMPDGKALPKMVCEADSPRVAISQAIVGEEPAHG